VTFISNLARTDKIIMNLEIPQVGLAMGSKVASWTRIY